MEPDRFADVIPFNLRSIIFPRASQNGCSTARHDQGGRSPEKPTRSAIPALIGIIIAPLVCIWVFKSEILYHSADLASIALTFAAVTVLLVLLGLRVIIPRIKRQSIILIYAVVAGTVGICTMGMVQFLITTLLAPFWYATPENRWQEFWSSIPSWAAPRSPEIIKGFFQGNSSLYDPVVWHAWVVPVLAWSGFIAALLAVQYCLAHLMYPRWANEERLTFPIAQVPLTLTESSDRPKYALMLGAAAALAVQGMNAVHYSYPSLPGLNVLPVEIGSTLVPPWNGLGQVWITFYPCIIGLSALVPTNILFSGVFFFWLTKLENLASHLWGLSGSGASGFPYPAEQAQGAVLAMALVVMWSARHHLRRSLSSQSDRAVWAGLVISSAVLFCYGLALGLRPIVSLLLFGLFMLFMVSAGWIRAAVGLVWNPGNDISWWTRALTGGGMPLGEGVGMAYLRWFSFGDFRAHALPAYVDVMRMSEITNTSRKRLLTTLAVGSFLCIIATMWIALDVYYKYGAATAMTDNWRRYQGKQAFDILRTQMDGFSPVPGMQQLEAAAFGGLAIFLLQIAQTKLLWWPLHPAGFVMAQTGCLEWLWLPMLIAAVVKAMLLRAGGLKLYRKTLPFFIGLVLGDYAISIFLTILSWLLGKPLYKPFPIT